MKSTELEKSKSDIALPIVPICYYCGNFKNKHELVLKDKAAADKMAEKLAVKKLATFLYAIDGAYPCPECRGRGIGVAEIVKKEKDDQQFDFTGYKWVVGPESLKHICHLSDEKLRAIISSGGMLLLFRESAISCGLHAALVDDMFVL